MYQVCELWFSSKEDANVIICKVICVIVYANLFLDLMWAYMFVISVDSEVPERVSKRMRLLHTK